MIHQFTFFFVPSNGIYRTELIATAAHLCYFYHDGKSK